MNLTVVQDAFLSVEGIVAVHNLRIWGLTTDKTALSAHLAISKIIRLISPILLFLQVTMTIHWHKEFVDLLRNPPACRYRDNLIL